MPEDDVALELTYNPVRGPRRRVTFTPRDDGRFTRTEYLWGGCRWRFCGSELVEDVDVERGRDADTATDHRRVDA